LPLNADFRAGLRRHPKGYAVIGAVAGLLVLLGLLALVRPRATRPMRVGYSDFYPYVSADGAGNPIGLAVQVVQRAAVRTGVPLQWIRVVDPENSLRLGQIDMFPLLTVTVARRRDLYMSVPWWEASQALLSRRDRPINDRSAAIGRTIAIRDLSFGAALAAQRLPGAILVRTRDTAVMISDVCSNRVEGALLDGRLVYAALLLQPPACAGRQLQLIPLANTALPMATVSTRARKEDADRVYAAIEELALDGTLTELTDRWLVMPQQSYIPGRLAQQQRLRLTGIFAASTLLLLVLSVWHSRRNSRMRRAAEEARIHAQQAEQRFEAFMKHSPAVKFMKDSAGRWRYVNRAFTQRFRIAPEACYGKTSEELWPPEAAAAMSDHDQQVLRDGPSGSGPGRDLLPLAHAEIPADGPGRQPLCRWDLN
jgi:ABC-type amino acid transport substrate-binding protein